jgi:hypothetical protein
MSKKTNKSKKPASLATVHSITDAIKQQSAIIAQAAVEQALTDNSDPNDDGTVTRETSTGGQTPKRRKGLARCYNLDRATTLVRATLELTNMRTSILTMDGWHARLRKVAAAQHAANALAKDHVQKRIIPSHLLGQAMTLTVARCLDYGVTADEATDLINKAMTKKIAEVCAPETDED